MDSSALFSSQLPEEIFLKIKEAIADCFPDATMKVIGNYKLKVKVGSFIENAPKNKLRDTISCVPSNTNEHSDVNDDVKLSKLKMHIELTKVEIDSEILAVSIKRIRGAHTMYRKVYSTIVSAIGDTLL